MAFIFLLTLIEKFFIDFVQKPANSQNRKPFLLKIQSAFEVKPFKGRTPNGIKLTVTS